MKTSLDLVSIGDLERDGAILQIQDGNHGEKHPKSTDYVADGVPFIMANNVVNNAVDVAGASKLPPALADGLRIGFAEDGDVLLTHKGTIGSTAIVRTELPYLMLTPQVTYYRTDQTKLLNSYLLYAFQEPLFHYIPYDDEGMRNAIGCKGCKKKFPLYGTARQERGGITSQIDWEKPKDWDPKEGRKV